MEYVKRHSIIMDDNINFRILFNSWLIITNILDITQLLKVKISIANVTFVTINSRNDPLILL